MQFMTKCATIREIIKECDPKSHQWIHNRLEIMNITDNAFSFDGNNPDAAYGYKVQGDALVHMYSVTYGETEPRTWYDNETVSYDWELGNLRIRIVDWNDGGYSVIYDMG